MPYMVTFTINIPQMLAYIPYMDPMGYIYIYIYIICQISGGKLVYTGSGVSRIYGLKSLELRD